MTNIPTSCLRIAAVSLAISVFVLLVNTQANSLVPTPLSWLAASLAAILLVVTVVELVRRRSAR